MHLSSWGLRHSGVWRWWSHVEEAEQLKSGSNHQGRAGMGPQVHILFTSSALPPPGVCCTQVLGQACSSDLRWSHTEAWGSLPGGTVPVTREAGARGQAGASPPVGPLCSHSRDTLIQGVDGPGPSGLAAAFPWRVLSEPAWTPLPGWGLHVTRLETWNCPKVPCRERAPAKSEISLQSTSAHPVFAL